jgi:hypothetical protein
MSACARRLDAGGAAFAAVCAANVPIVSSQPLWRKSLTYNHFVCRKCVVRVHGASACATPIRFCRPDRFALFE